MPNIPKPKVTVRNFIFQRVRTVPGSGVRLLFGSYAFILVNNMDGTPERTLDTAGVERILKAVYRMPKEPPVSPPSGRTGPIAGHA